MRQFRDAEGTTWKLSIHFGNLPIVKQETGVRLSLIEHPILLEGDDPELWRDENGEVVPGITRLFQDVELVYEIIFCLVSEQAESLEVSKLEFAKRLSADGVQHKAFLAFWEELQNFFRSTRKDQIAEAISQYTNLLQALIQQMSTQLSLSPSSTNENSPTKKSSGEAQATSESTQEPSLSGKSTG